MILNWCRRRGVNLCDSEEIAAVVLSNLVTAMARFEYDPNRRFRGWLKTVVINEIHGFWRRHMRRPGDHGSGDPQHLRRLEELIAPTALDSLAAELDTRLNFDLQLAHEIIDRVSARVEPQTWQAYWQTEVEGLAVEEVARRLNMKVSTLYVAKSRVARMLREEGENGRSSL